MTVGIHSSRYTTECCKYVGDSCAYIVCWWYAEEEKGMLARVEELRGAGGFKESK